MLAKDPAERWPTIGQAVQALGGGPLAEDDPLRETLAAMAGATATSPGSPPLSRAPLTPPAPTPPPPPPPPVPGAVDVMVPESAAGDWEVGDTVQAAAAVRATDGAPMPDAEVTWTSDAPSVAVVDATGRVELRAPGTATLRATAGEARGEVTLQVAPARPATITVGAAPDPLRVGDLWRPAVTVRDRRGAPLEAPVSLELLDGSRGVARVTGGEVEALAAGATTLRVTAGGLTQDVPLAVTRAAVATLEVSLDADSSAAEPEVGDTLRGVARARDRRGQLVADAPIHWRSSDARVATVDETGAVTTVGVGTATVSAEADGRRGSVTVRVRRPAVARLELEVPAVALRAGERTRLRAVARDRRGTVLDARERPVRWAAADAAVLDVTPDGAAEAIAPGTTWVTAECEGQQARAEVRVMAASITELFRPVPAPTPAPPAVVAPEPEPELDLEMAADTAPSMTTLAFEAPRVAEPRPAETTTAETAVAEPEPAVTTTAETVAPAVEEPETAPARVPEYAPAARTELPPPPAVAPAPVPGNRRFVGPAVAAGVLLALGGWWMSTRNTTPSGPQIVDTTTVDTATSVGPATGPATGTPATGTPATGTPASGGNPAATAGGAAGAGTGANTKPDVKTAAERAKAARDSAARVAAARRDSAARVVAARRDSTARAAAARDSVARVAAARDSAARAVAARDSAARASAARDSAARAAREQRNAAAREAARESAAANAVTEARAGMQRAIDAYVSGISNRSLAEMQRVYPTMPSSMRSAWDGTFKSVRNVDAEAKVANLSTAAGNESGSATVSLSVSFANPATKRPCTNTTQLQMQLARAGGAWRIASLNQVGDATQSAGCR
jgi:hypothetical protein